MDQGQFEERVLRPSGALNHSPQAAKRAALAESGYVVLDDLLASPQKEDFTGKCEELWGREQGHQSDRASGTRHVSDLLVLGLTAERLLLDARVLAHVWDVLQRPFVLHQLSFRDPLPGFGKQGLHADWLPRNRGEGASVVTALWMLDSFTSTNGATRLVPGTHRICGPIPRTMGSPDDKHPDQVTITARAGSVLIFDGHLWHGGTSNASRGPRRAVQQQFVARELRSPAAPLPELAPGFSDPARVLVGFD